MELALVRRGGSRAFCYFFAFRSFNLNPKAQKKNPPKP